ncbi:MAG: hypothetical protein O2794_03635 [bacterium]|nr:hypothetical protein [bacterium]
MVLSRFFKIELKGVHQAALLLAFTSIFNGVLGLFRDRLLASNFGASRMLDMYYAAFRVPDIIFSLSLFFIASTAFIPLFLEHRNRSQKEAQLFFDSIFSIFLGAVIVLVVIAFFVLPHVIPFVVPGFSLEEQANTLILSRIMLLSPVFFGISSIVSGVIQSAKKFFAYAMAPIMYNGGIILGILFFFPRYGFSGLAYGVVLGALLHLFVQLPTLLKLHSLPRIRFSRAARPFQIFKYSFPRAFALSFNQITLLILTAVASTLSAGAISIFNLSHSLYSLPLIIIGLSYSVAAFPSMAELALKNEKKVFFDHLVSATRHILFWTVPITALFIVFRAHIVRLVLGAGAFGWIDTHLTIASLFLFSFAIMAQSLVTLFVRAYYALAKVRQPILYNAISSAVIIFVAFFSIWILDTSLVFKEGFAKLLHVGLENIAERDITLLGLPLAFSIGSLTNAILLGRGLFRMNGENEIKKLMRSFRRILAAAIGMSATAYLVLQVLGRSFTFDTFIGLSLQAGIALVVSLGVGMFLFRKLGVEEFEDIVSALHTKFRKQKNVLQPEVEHL